MLALSPGARASPPDPAAAAAALLEAGNKSAESLVSLRAQQESFAEARDRVRELSEQDESNVSLEKELLEASRKCELQENNIEQVSAAEQRARGEATALQQQGQPEESEAAVSTGPITDKEVKEYLDKCGVAKLSPTCPDTTNLAAKVDPNIWFTFIFH